MAEGQDTARNIISVTVKSTKDKKTIEIGEDADIKEVCKSAHVGSPSKPAGTRQSFINENPPTQLSTPIALVMCLPSALSSPESPFQSPCPNR